MAGFPQKRGKPAYHSSLYNHQRRRSYRRGGNHGQARGSLLFSTVGHPATRGGHNSSLQHIYANPPNSRLSFQPAQEYNQDDNNNKIQSSTLTANRAICSLLQHPNQSPPTSTSHRRPSQQAQSRLHRRPSSSSKYCIDFSTCNKTIQTNPKPIDNSIGTPFFPLSSHLVPRTRAIRTASTKGKRGGFNKGGVKKEGITHQGFVVSRWLGGR